MACLPASGVSLPNHLAGICVEIWVRKAGKTCIRPLGQTRLGPQAQGDGVLDYRGLRGV